MTASWNRPLRPVLFHHVAEWERDDEPVRNAWVWMAFDDRLVATGEHEGPDNHAGVWPAGAFLATWRDRVTGTPAGWLLAHLERFAQGEDVRDAVLADFAARHHGDSPPTTVWNLAR